MSPQKPPAAAPKEKLPERGYTGAQFIFEAFNDEQRSLWGSGDRVLWSGGEPFMICGPPGVGKSTILQQLVLARIEVLSPSFLGMRVEPLEEGRGLYLAMDRPPQIKRSFGRMVTEDDTKLLNERLRVHGGPLPPAVNVVSDPYSLAEWIEENYPKTRDLYIDSLYVMAPKLSQDDVGNAVSFAVQELIAREINVAVLHHPRKANGDNKKPTSLDDVYGSTWITSTMGSVAFLYAKEAGATVVEFTHIKQPAEPVEPMFITHDKLSGTSTAGHAANDVMAMLIAAGARGVTKREVAENVFGSALPSVEQKARRRLEALVKEGSARHDPGKAGGASGATKSGRWFVQVQGA